MFINWKELHSIQVFAPQCFWFPSIAATDGIPMVPNILHVIAQTYSTVTKLVLLILYFHCEMLNSFDHFSTATNEKNKENKPNSLSWESTYDPLQNNDLKKYKRSESLTGPASNSTLISRTQALRKATDGAHSLDLEKKQIGDSFQRISEQNMGHQRELHDLASHGPRSMSFYENHYSEEKQRENGRKSPFYGSSPTLSEKPYYDPPSYGESISASKSLFILYNAFHVIGSSKYFSVMAMR